jgi:hypothetical protein
VAKALPLKNIVLTLPNLYDAERKLEKGLVVCDLVQILVQGGEAKHIFLASTDTRYENSGD